jgi:cytochrome P450
MLMAAQDSETGATMNDRQLRDEVMTLIGAGYETTTQALGWTWYLLGKNPSVEMKLRREIELVLGGRAPTFADLPRLEYTRMVFQEAMRLYPPVWAFSRVAIERDEIGGFYVPPKSEVLLFPFITHRHAKFWDVPEEFLPERFSAESSINRPKFAYFPFGGGARQCIGNHFAQMEAQIIIAMTLQKFRVRLDENHAVEAETSVTLRPRNGVKVILEKV